MKGFKEVLMEEQERLENILQQTEQRLADAPEGSLRLSVNGKRIQYYHYFPGDTTTGKYISKSQKVLIHRLAQKSYDEKIRKTVEKRLKQIRKITKDYDEKEIENVYLNESKNRQQLIRPAVPMWEQCLETWMSGEYEPKGFREEDPVIVTDRGERVRSKSEKILADYFYRQGIPYKYECPLYLKGFRQVYPDFTFLSRRTGKEIYWEHHGRMDDPLYAQNMVKKLQAYEENGIFPGERLILTFETEKTVLNTRMIERMVLRYLM